MWKLVLVVAVLLLMAFQYPGSDWQYERQQLLKELQEANLKIAGLEEAQEEDYYRGMSDICNYFATKALRNRSAARELCSVIIDEAKAGRWFEQESPEFKWDRGKTWLQPS